MRSDNPKLRRSGSGSEILRDRGGIIGSAATYEQWRSALADWCRREGSTALQDEPLRRHCTWRIGGPADFLCEPTSWPQVVRLRRYADEHGIPVVVIGRGSNLLFCDEGVRGLVLKIGRTLGGLSIAGTSVRVGAGLATPRLARAVGLAGLSGIEHIVGIPGTLGGLIVMNGGSSRRTIGEVTVQVRTIDRRGVERLWPRDECAFAYRASRFQREEVIITEVVLELVAGDSAAIMAEMCEILRQRRRQFPLTLPSCGSVFKRDMRVLDRLGPPGAVIDRLGLKGLRIGDAVVDSRHANFIVNVGAARARDVLDVVAAIRRRAREELGYTMACEARYVDERGRVRPLDACLPAV